MQAPFQTDSNAQSDTLAAHTPTRAVPLCVDLDGTLVRTDLLLESFLLLIKRNPLYLLLIPSWLLGGKAVLKDEIAARVHLNAATLPYDREFLAWLRAVRSEGTDLWLCTAASQRLAHSVAAYVGLFEGVLASDRDTNLAGSAKGRRLVELFGEGGFDYCGNERRDLRVWQWARGAVVVRGGVQLEREAANVTRIIRCFSSNSRPLRAMIRALHPRRWAASALVVLPLLAAQRAFDRPGLMVGLGAFVAFSLCASSAYILNDLLDLEADRTDVSKSKRPFAAGDLSVLTGMLMAPCLLLAGALTATLLPPELRWGLGGSYLLACMSCFTPRIRELL